MASAAFMARFADLLQLDAIAQYKGKVLGQCRPESLPSGSTQCAPCQGEHIEIAGPVELSVLRSETSRARVCR